MSDEIINKLAQSALVSLDLEDYYPEEKIVLFDLKPLLFREMILKEKEFRAALPAIDWASYQDKIVAVTCTADSIIPLWAYMLVAVYLEPFAKNLIFGDEETALRQTFLDKIAAIDLSKLTDKRVVVKGCGDKPVGAFAYMEIARRLRPVVKSIMYGEPCSTVPVYKKK
jgi:Protein of unknown function (DUF2480)